jgi:hypothetical protein
MLVESENVLFWLVECGTQEYQYCDRNKDMTMPQWLEMIRIRQNRDIQVACLAFDEELNTPFIRIRMIEIREAQETMERGVSERANFSTFLARGPVRRRAARLIIVRTRG